MIAEWDRNTRLFFAWPHSVVDWQDNLIAAQEEILEAVRLIQKEVSGVALVFRSESDCPVEELTDQGVSCCSNEEYREVWMRDSSPLYYKKDNEVVAARFLFNSWGGKYPLDQDACFYDQVLKFSQTNSRNFNFVLEGGAVDFNGRGLCLTTEECLLNPNRNSGFSKKEYEEIFAQEFGVSDILWIPNGMSFDHTDGHVDNVARFIDSQTIMIHDSTTAPSYQREALKEIERFMDLECRKRNLRLLKVPCPEAEVIGPEGDPCPLSYLNFNLFRKGCFIPSYRVEGEERIMELFSRVLPEYKARMIPSRTLIQGGGSLHCLSHQMA